MKNTKEIIYQFLLDNIDLLYSSSSINEELELEELELSKYLKTLVKEKRISKEYDIKFNGNRGKFIWYYGIITL